MCLAVTSTVPVQTLCTLTSYAQIMRKMFTKIHADLYEKSPKLLSILTKFGMGHQMSATLPNTKFYSHSLCHSQVVQCRQMWICSFLQQMHRKLAT
jgi:hypothetical protein